ncbi:hypothetical protein B566_EDAN011841 [Ephemera danica]|nr:hypothetical protein B566_EDAN011841 [Ephemera danica]
MVTARFKLLIGYCSVPADYGYGNNYDGGYGRGGRGKDWGASLLHQYCALSWLAAWHCGEREAQDMEEESRGEAGVDRSKDINPINYKLVQSGAMYTLWCISYLVLTNPKIYQSSASSLL